MFKGFENLLGSNMTMEQCELANRISADITNVYTEQYRYYHTLENHINPCLKEYREIEDLIIGKQSFALALLYHDYIYIPGGLYNEKANADRATFDLRRLNELVIEINGSRNFVAV